MERMSASPHTKLVPALRYRDVAAAADWLCAVLGFGEHHVVTAVDGTVVLAQLTFGDDMVMLLPLRGPAGVKPSTPPHDYRVETQSCYFVVEDADVHYRAAKAAGADILDNTDYDYGGRGYSCRDPEGHIWNFGTYDPRGQELANEPFEAQPITGRTRFPPFPFKFGKPDSAVMITALAAFVIAAVLGAWMLLALPQPALSEKEMSRPKQAAMATKRDPEEIARAAQILMKGNSKEERSAALDRDVNAKNATDRAAALKQVQPERSSKDHAHEAKVRQRVEVGHGGAKDTAERVTAAELLPPERGAGKGTEPTQRSQVQQPAELGPELGGKGAQERTVPGTLKAGEPDAKEVVERAAQDALEQLARQRSAKGASERTAKDTGAKVSEVQSAKAVQPKDAKTSGEPLKTAAAPASGGGQAPVKSAKIVTKDAKQGRAPSKGSSSPPFVERQERRLAQVQSAKKIAPGSRQSQEQFWECLPRPPNGQVVCHPITGSGKD